MFLVGRRHRARRALSRRASRRGPHHDVHRRLVALDIFQCVVITILDCDFALFTSIVACVHVRVPTHAVARARGEIFSHPRPRRFQ